MREKIFLDANVIISGTFFEGNESKLISLEDIDIYTSDVVVMEVKEVALKKFKSLKMEDKSNFKVKQIVQVRHTREVLEDLGILSRT